MKARTIIRYSICSAIAGAVSGATLLPLLYKGVWGTEDHAWLCLESTVLFAIAGALIGWSVARSSNT
jgi:hypothetical protein